MKEYRFNISLSYEEFAAYYEGAVHDVIATSWGGTRVRFSAAKLRPFLTHGGIHGTFVMVVDEHNRFVSLQKIG